MSAAVFCRVDPAREADRHRLHGEHLAYIAAHRQLIVAGGPTLHDDNSPDTMVILLDVPDVAAARAFIEAEPYIAHGVFDRVEVRAWARVLPDAMPGAFDVAPAEALQAPAPSGDPAGAAG